MGAFLRWFFLVSTAIYVWDIQRRVALVVPLTRDEGRRAASYAGGGPLRERDPAAPKP